MRKVVGKGYRNANLLGTDSVLSPLREREDFKKPLEELEQCNHPPSRRKRHERGNAVIQGLVVRRHDITSFRGAQVSPSTCVGIFFPLRPALD